MNRICVVNFFCHTLGGVLLDFDILAKTAVPRAELQLGAGFLLFLAELYSYTEGPEFLLNRKCFEEDFRIHGKSLFLDSSPPGEGQQFLFMKERNLMPELTGVCSYSCRTALI